MLKPVAQFSIIGSLTLRESSSRFGNAFCVPIVWSPYRITPIHWRTHVVSLYRRTRHLLLRFLCLHEAAILPFGCNFSGPILHTYGHGFSVCTSATAYSGTLFSSRWSAMEYRRCQPPCAQFIASDNPHSKCVKCLGFSYAREAVYGIFKCKFCENLSLKTLRSRLEVLEKESSVFPLHAP